MAYNNHDTLVHGTSKLNVFQMKFHKLGIIYIYKNNLKIMILKRGVGIDHCYKK